MTQSFSEPTRVGDVLKWETFQGFCREKKTAKSGETLNIGFVAELEQTDVDEVQTCSVFTGTGSAGTYTLTFWDAHDQIFRTTADIADAANIATIQAAIDLAASGGSSGIVVGGTIESTSWSFTYSGVAYSGIDVPLIAIDISSWTGVTVVTFVETTKGRNTTLEVQTNTGWDGTGTAGTFTITFWDPIAGAFVTTAAIADAASLGTIQTALDTAASGSSAGITVGGTIESITWSLTYTLTQYSDIDVPMATVDVSSWTGVTAAIFTETTKGGVKTQKAIRVATAENASLICLENLGTLSADTPAMFLARGPAIVDKDQLDYNSLAPLVVDIRLQALHILPIFEPATLVTQTT